MKKNRIKKGLKKAMLYGAFSLGIIAVTGTENVMAYTYSKTGAYQDGTVTIEELVDGKQVNGYGLPAGYKVSYSITRNDWVAFDAQNGSDFFIGSNLSPTGGCHFCYKPDGNIWETGALNLGAITDGLKIGSASPDANGTVSTTFQVTSLSNLPAYIGYSYQPAGGAYLHISELYGNNNHIWYYQNLSNNPVITKNNVDRTPPTLSIKAEPKGESVAANGKTWAREALVTATATDNQSRPGGINMYHDNMLAYVAGNNSNGEQLNAVYITKLNGSYTCEGQDMLGNVAEKKGITVDFIDLTGPVISKLSLQNEGYCKSNVLTVNASDAGCGLQTKSYSYNSGTWTNSNTLTITENGTYTVMVRDALGNVSSKNITVTGIDRSVPVIQSFTQKNKNYCAEDVLTVVASDTGSGLAPQAYSFNNGEWQKDNTFSVKENGVYKVSVRDAVGNMSEQSLTVTNIDKSAPEIKSFTQKNSDYCLEDVLTVQAADAESGLAAEAYSFNDGAWTSNNTFTISENGTYKVKVRDAVGNVSEKSLTVSNIDKESPELSVEVQSVGETVLVGDSEWAKEKDLIIKASDAKSGIASICIYAPDGKLYDKYEVNPAEKTVEYVSASVPKDAYKIEVLDQLLNKNTKDVSVGNVDNKPPVIIGVQTENVDDELVKVVIDAKDSDEGIGLAKEAYSVDGGKKWQESNAFYVNASGTYQIMVRDMLGLHANRNVAVKTKKDAEAENKKNDSGNGDGSSGSGGNGDGSSGSGGNGDGSNGSGGNGDGSSGSGGNGDGSNGSGGNGDGSNGSGGNGDGSNGSGGNGDGSKGNDGNGSQPQKKMDKNDKKQTDLNDDREKQKPDDENALTPDGDLGTGFTTPGDDSDMEESIVSQKFKEYQNNLEKEIKETKRNDEPGLQEKAELQKKTVKRVAATVLIALLLLGLSGLALYILLGYLHYKCVLYALDDKNKKKRLGLLPIQTMGDEWLVDVPDHKLGTIGTGKYVLAFRSAFVKEESDSFIVIVIDKNRIREKVDYEIEISI